MTEVTLVDLEYTEEEINDMNKKLEEAGDGNMETLEIHPTMADPEWNDYVMKQFVDEELFDGAPTVDGLRRVTCKLLGPIIEVNTQLVQVPEWGIGKNSRATAVVTVVVDDRLLGIIKFSDAADADPNSTDGEFMKFPTAIAVTRAEARALRKMLKLRKPAAEEMSNSDPVEKETDLSLITPIQVKGITNTSKALGIDPNKLIGIGKAKKGNLKEATYLEARGMMEILNKYRSNPESIPDNIKV